MKVSFSHSKDREMQRLLRLRDEYQWFIENDFPVVVPEFYDTLYHNAGSEDVFKDRLVEAFNNVYRESKYVEKERKVRDIWQRVEQPFFDTLNSLRLDVLDEYFCYVSLYGPQGQFHCPDVVDVRVASDKDVEEANTTIAHEIIHLVISDKVSKLKLSYSQVEGMVDLFFTETELKDIFPIYEPQSIAEHDREAFYKFIS